MQVSVETTSGLERRMTVSVPAETVDSAVESKLKETAKKVKLDGFRPGKVPVREVKRRFGASIRQEVLGDVIQSSFYEAIGKESLQLAGMPNIEPSNDKAGEDFEYIATFDVYPEVTLGDTSTVSVEKMQAEIVDADVDTMIETLRQQRANFEVVERAAEDGDQVNLDYEGLKDGVAFDGGTAQASDLVLGSNQFIPGFEEGLIGAVAGEERSLNLTFPEDYNTEDLKGADVVFNVKINSVQSKALPEIDAEFMQSFGIKTDNLEQFKVDVRKNMQRELNNAIKANVKQQVMEQLIEQNELEVPASLVKQEITRQKQGMMQQFGGGQQLDDSMLPDDLFSEQAERSVKLGLLMAELIKSQDIKADGDRVRSTIEEMAESYESPEEVVNWYYSNQQQLQQVESVVLEEQVVESILANATVTEKAVSYEEAVKPAAEA